MSRQVVGTVATTDGWPIGHAIVTMVDAVGQQRACRPVGNDGGFAVNDLPAGNYTLIVSAAGHTPLARTITVAGDRPTQLGVLECQRAASLTLPAPGVWVIDPVHSSIAATAFHLGLTKIHGRLREFTGQIVVAEELENSSVEVTINSASVQTDSPDRDVHLRNADFLHVDRYPSITYKSDTVQRTSPTRWLMTGPLTVRDVSRPVQLDVTYLGTGPDPWGGVRAGFTASAQLSRDDFSMTWNQSVLAGIFAVGRTLRIDIDIQAVRQ